MRTFNNNNNNIMVNDDGIGGFRGSKEMREILQALA